ncbi:MAG TPA: hypothetical protein VGX92_17770 [Pyrinomonadaceae bacterium]|jgi:hypothetical protein|nr:hypothetical protein [Pyrinomonadaceae bacterium]
MKRRIEITIETERVVVVRRRRARKSLTLWCRGCGAESLMLTADEAARFAGMSSMAVFRLAEAGHLHWQETGAGALLVCRNSLLRSRTALRETPDRR